MTVVSVEGLRELDDALEDLSKAAGKAAMRRALITSAGPLAALMAALAPRDTGKLSLSIGVGPKLTKAQRKGARTETKSSVEIYVGASRKLGARGRHAHLQEFGTPHHAAQPFARPAWSQEQRPTLERLKVEAWAEIQKALERAQRRAARLARG